MLNVVVFSDALVGTSVALELSTMVIDSVLEATVLVVLAVLVSELAGLVDDSVGREEEDVEDDTGDNR